QEFRRAQPVSQELPSSLPIHPAIFQALERTDWMVRFAPWRAARRLGEKSVASLALHAQPRIPPCPSQQHRAHGQGLPPARLCITQESEKWIRFPRKTASLFPV